MSFTALDRVLVGPNTPKSRLFFSFTLTNYLHYICSSPDQLVQYSEVVYIFCFRLIVYAQVPTRIPMITFLHRWLLYNWYTLLENESNLVILAIYEFLITLRWILWYHHLSGLRGVGCSIVSGLFVLFNMFYFQPRFASPSTNAMNIEPLTDRELAKLKKEKILEARRVMLFGLGGVSLVMCVCRFLYGISCSFDSPTCFVLLFIGKSKLINVI